MVGETRGPRTVSPCISGQPSLSHTQIHSVSQDTPDTKHKNIPQHRDKQYYLHSDIHCFHFHFHFSLTMVESTYRRHCKNLFADCYSYSDEDSSNTTLSPYLSLSTSSSSPSSSVTVTGISAVWNMTLIILSSISVSIISIYSVLIIHRQVSHKLA